MLLFGLKLDGGLGLLEKIAVLFLFLLATSLHLFDLGSSSSCLSSVYFANIFFFKSVFLSSPDSNCLIYTRSFSILSANCFHRIDLFPLVRRKIIGLTTSSTSDDEIVW